MPAGSGGQRAVDLIGAEFPAILAEVSRDFDLVILDAPPMLTAPEAQEVAGFADSVMMVTRAGAANEKAIVEALSLLRRARANVVGLVMNQVKYPDLGRYGYYYSFQRS